MALYSKEERYDEAAVKAMAEAYEKVLTTCGEDPQREGLLKTPMQRLLC